MNTTLVTHTLLKLNRQKYLFMLLLPGLVYFIIFKYVPMYGVVLAFKEFNPMDGILGSPWAGMKYFNQIFQSDSIHQVVYNTLRISLLKLVFAFPAPIMFALLMNELAGNAFKHAVQTISYLPHFLSWVVISGLIFQLLSPSYGLYGYVANMFGWKTQVLLAQPNTFLTILVSSEIWKEFGYGSVIYLAAIAGISGELYEAARMDGAGRFKMMVHITLPSLLPIISILFILQLGHVLDGGFDQIMNLYNPLVYGVADVVDTYVYRMGLANFQYSFGTAVGLFKGIVAMILVISTNYIVRKTTDHSIW
ncbi:ABC transporter permease [Paenibacillus roseipurpureus]|uniref:ABC transporter permease subunit n=1 Tax=Paenibacillus roseopurpureus TaxID=2918901 RepID=A0AA96LRH0_9BACL|nr:ABC transporter permease subunit [Paenibacillus sp. MBLB1832]WNR45953.1 ABC transporter permease subunit [Paenibacillus sp. MBLB1832]